MAATLSSDGCTDAAEVHAAVPHLTAHCTAHDVDAALKALYAVLPFQQLPQIPAAAFAWASTIISLGAATSALPQMSNRNQRSAPRKLERSHVLLGPLSRRHGDGLLQHLHRLVLRPVLRQQRAKRIQYLRILRGKSFVPSFLPHQTPIFPSHAYLHSALHGACMLLLRVHKRHQLGGVAEATIAAVV